jgi:cell volume regulation protein A
VHLVDQTLVPLGEAEEHEQTEYFGDFTLNGDARMQELAGVYGISVPPLAKRLTLAEFLDKRFHKRCVVGDRVLLGALELVVREIDNATVSKVGVRVLRS